MNDALFAATACLVGLGVSAPLGPVALLALRRGLSGDGVGAALTGCGAGLADSLIVLTTLIAATLLGEVLSSLRSPLAFVGGLLLIALAVVGARARTASLGEGDRPAFRTLGRRALRALEGFGIAGTNPGNIAAVSAVALTTLVRPGLGQPDLYALAGFTLGSQIWWIGLGVVSARLRQRLAGLWLRRITLGVSAVLGLLGLGMIGWAAGAAFFGVSFDAAAPQPRPQP